MEGDRTMLGDFEGDNGCGYVAAKDAMEKQSIWLLRTALRS